MSPSLLALVAKSSSLGLPFTIRKALISSWALCGGLPFLLVPGCLEAGPALPFLEGLELSLLVLATWVTSLLELEQTPPPAA